MEEVPVDTGTPDFTFDTRPDFEEDDLDDFLSSFLCSTRSFSLITLWIAPLMAGNASQYLELSKYVSLESLNHTDNTRENALTIVRLFPDHS